MLALDKINHITSTAYDLTAKRYHDLFHNELENKPYDRELLRKFSSYFGTESIVYDMGCGPSGHISKFVSDCRIPVVGVDISVQCIKIAQKQNSKISFQVMDMTKLNLKDSSIDGIISYYSIIHIPKLYINQVFKEFHRVLKKSGKMIVTVKEGGETGMIENFLESGAPIYFTYFDEKEILKYFVKNRFKIIYNDIRKPYQDEINVSRIFVIGQKI